MHTLRTETSFSRRGLLALGGAATGLLAFRAAPGRPTGAGKLPDRPFQLGVASGEPRPDSVVLWTRPAPRPLAEDGFGGMPDRPVPVRWEIAAGRRGTGVTAPPPVPRP